MVREDVYNAIFSLLNGLVPGTLKSASRRLLHIEDVTPDAMPCAFQNQVSESAFGDTMVGGQMTSINLLWYVYVAVDNESDDPSTPTLNPVVDAVVNLLPNINNQIAIQIDGVTCQLRRGAIQYFEGLLGTKAVAKIEVIVLAPFA